MVKTKVCGICKAELSIDNFGLDNSRKDKLNTRCKKCNNERIRAYYNKNKELKSKQDKEYYIKNKEKLLDNMKIYQRENKQSIFENKKKYREENKESISLHKKEYYKQNKHIAVAAKQRRKAIKKSLPATLNNKQWENIKLYFNNECCYCGKELPLAQEHFIPLSNGGEYTHNNIIPACQSCNSSKNNKDFFEWYPKQKCYSKKRERKILDFLNYKNRVQQLKLAIGD